jgi:hypothetical protein
VPLAQACDCLAPSQTATSHRSNCLLWRRPQACAVHCRLEQSDSLAADRSRESFECEGVRRRLTALDDGTSLTVPASPSPLSCRLPRAFRPRLPLPINDTATTTQAATGHIAAALPWTNKGASDGRRAPPRLRRVGMGEEEELSGQSRQRAATRCSRRRTRRARTPASHCAARPPGTLSRAPRPTPTTRTATAASRSGRGGARWRRRARGTARRPRPS